MRIDVEEYDAGWAAAFEDVRAQLWTALSAADVVAIEHVGSTAVPGLAAKPILDIDVIVPRDGVTSAILALGAVGYAYRGDLGIPDRHAFWAPAKGPARHVYVCVQGALAVRNHLAVRDLLRSDDMLRDAYGALKLRLSEQDFDDIDAYTAQKSPMVQEILRRAGVGDEERDAVGRVNPR